MFKKICTTLLLSSLCLSTSQAEISCDEISTLRKNVFRSELAVKYSKETEISMTELARESKNTKNLSSGLFLASALLINAGWISSAGEGALAGNMLWKIKSGAAKLLIVPMLNSTIPGASAVAFTSTVAFMFGPGALGITQGYFSFFDNSTKKWVKLTQKEMQTLDQELKVHYDIIHQQIRKKINDVDLDFSKLADGLSLGRKSANATEKLRALYELDRVTYEKELFSNIKRLKTVEDHCSKNILNPNNIKSTGVAPKLTDSKNINDAKREFKEKQTDNADPVTSPASAGAVSK